MLDMWTDVFASPGWRTTGTQAGNFIIVPPGWRPDLKDRLIEEFKLPKDTQRIDAPTPYVWVIGRTKTDGPPDYDAVHKIQAGYKVTPLSHFGKAPEPLQVKIDPTVDMKTPPKVQVDTMPAGKYFAYACRTTEVASAAHHGSTDHRADEDGSASSRARVSTSKRSTRLSRKASKVCRKLLRS